MKIVVLVKSVPDTGGTPEIAPDGRSVEVAHLESVLNPYDEYAVEEAVRLQESAAAEVTAVSFGDDDGRHALRAAFAMGVPAALLVRPPTGEPLTGRGVALCLASVLRDLAPDLVMAGKQAVDDDGAQVAERVAELLGLQHASAVTRLTLENERLRVDRQIEGGRLTLEMPLPALITVDKGINIPRYPALPQILRARRLPIREVDPSLSAADLTPGWWTASLATPSQERRRQVYPEAQSGLDALVRLLADESLA